MYLGCCQGNEDLWTSGSDDIACVTVTLAQRGGAEMEMTLWPPSWQEGLSLGAKKSGLAGAASPGRKPRV